MTLSVEFFYPDCPNCGASGDLNTVMLQNEIPGCPECRWKCLACDGSFRTPETSPWRGVFDLDPEIRSAYVNCVIGGVTQKRHANGKGFTASAAKHRVRKARQQLGVTPDAAAD